MMDRCALGVIREPGAQKPTPSHDLRQGWTRTASGLRAPPFPPVCAGHDRATLTVTRGGTLITVWKEVSVMNRFSALAIASSPSPWGWPPDPPRPRPPGTPQPRRPGTPLPRAPGLPSAAAPVTSVSTATGTGVAPAASGPTSSGRIPPTTARSSSGARTSAPCGTRPGTACSTTPRPTTTPGSAPPRRQRRQPPGELPDPFLQAPVAPTAPEVWRSSPADGRGGPPHVRGPACGASPWTASMTAG